MGGTVNHERSAPAGVNYRWWLMVVILLVGAGMFLILPSRMHPVRRSLPIAAMLMAVAMAAWVRWGPQHRRVSTSGFKADLPAATQTDLAPSDCTTSVTEAPAVLQPVETASIAPVVPKIDAECLERVLAHHKAGLVRADGGNVSPDTVVDHVRTCVRSAIQRVLARGRAGDAAAQAAVEQVRESMSLSGVQAVLTEIVSRPADGHGRTPQDCRDIARERAAIALLAGRTGDVRRFFDEVADSSQGDAAMLDLLALAAELQGDAAEAQQWYTRLLEVDAEPMLKASAYGSLGLICQTCEELDLAEQMHRAALAIYEQLGRLDDVANQSAQLGAVHEMRGEVDLAESMYRRALGIHEQLGRLDGMAGQYVNLGLLASQRDDTTGANEFWSQARDLFTRAGLMGNARLVQQFLDELVTS